MATTDNVYLTIVVGVRLWLAFFVAGDDPVNGGGPDGLGGSLCTIHKRGWQLTAKRPFALRGEMEGRGRQADGRHGVVIAGGVSESSIPVWGTETGRPVPADARIAEISPAVAVAARGDVEEI